MFTEIAHLPKLLSISSSIVEIFLSIKNGKNFAQAKLLYKNFINKENEGLNYI